MLVELGRILVTIISLFKNYRRFESKQLKIIFKCFLEHERVFTSTAYKLKKMVLTHPDVQVHRVSHRNIYMSGLLSEKAIEVHNSITILTWKKLYWNKFLSWKMTKIWVNCQPMYVITNKYYASNALLHSISAMVT